MDTITLVLPHNIEIVVPAQYARNPGYTYIPGDVPVEICKHPALGTRDISGYTVDYVVMDGDSDRFLLRDNVREELIPNNMLNDGLYIVGNGKVQFDMFWSARERRWHDIHGRFGASPGELAEHKLRITEIIAID